VITPPASPTGGAFNTGVFMLGIEMRKLEELVRQSQKEGLSILPVVLVGYSPPSLASSRARLALGRVMHHAGIDDGETLQKLKALDGVEQTTKVTRER